MNQQMSLLQKPYWIPKLVVVECFQYFQVAVHNIPWEVHSISRHFA